MTTLERVKQVIANESPELVARLMADLIERNKNMEARIKAIEAAQAERDQAAFVFEEQVKLLRRQIFGKSSEKRSDASDRPRDKSQEEALLFSQAAFPSPKKRSDEKGKAKGQELETVVIEQCMLDDDLKAESQDRGVKDASAKQWVDTGIVEEVVKIQIIERKYVRELHRKHK